MVRSARNAGRAGAAPAEVMQLTRRMAMLFRDRLDEQLKPLEVTAAQLKLLAALIEEPGTSGAQISRFCHVTPQTTHALLAAVERRGWIARSPHPENPHTLLATLTPQGRRIFLLGKRIALRLQRQMLRTLTAPEVKRLEATLECLIKNLE